MVLPMAARSAANYFIKKLFLSTIPKGTQRQKTLRKLLEVPILLESGRVSLPMVVCYSPHADQSKEKLRF